MKTKKIILIAIVILLVTVVALGYYQYNRAAPGVAGLTAETVSATALFKNFETNEQLANNKFLNKPLQVTGKILEIKTHPGEPMQIILDAGDPMFGIACTMENDQKNVQPGEQVTIKGICTGYLNDVVIIKSLLLN